MKDNKKCAAIILAAGSGKRMGGDKPKQFLTVCGKPLLYYSIKAFQESFIDEIVIVTKAENIDYVKEDIVKTYSFDKVSFIVEGGKERYHSVACGLEALCNLKCDYVFIHDGARPFVTEQILESAFEGVNKYHAAVAAVPSKDTVKLRDDDGFVSQTPNRKSVYIMQTPQTFEYERILGCYRKLVEKEDEVLKTGVIITDDAMVMEYFEKECKIYLSEGDYRNIKVTTPEDMRIAELYAEDLKLC